MKHLYIGHLSFSTVQYSGQAHSKGKVPIFGKILCTVQWCQQKQDNKTKNRTVNRFHFIPPKNASVPQFALWRLFWLQRQCLVWAKSLAGSRPTQSDMQTAVPQLRLNPPLPC